MDYILTETLAADEDMANMNLTWIDANNGQRPKNMEDHVETEAILETVRRDLQKIARFLHEINEKIDDTREVLNITLDSQRNSILKLNLQASLVTLSLTAIAVPAGILGMNVPLMGLEESHGAFPMILSCMMVVGTSMYLIPVSYFYYQFEHKTRQNIKELLALNHTLKDIDIIERVFHKMGAQYDNITREDFKRDLSQATCREISEEEMDLISAAFDDDNDGELQYATYRRIVDQATNLELETSYGNFISEAVEKGIKLSTLARDVQVERKPAMDASRSQLEHEAYTDTEKKDLKGINNTPKPS